MVTSTIGVVVRDTPYSKLLSPICSDLYNRKVPYTLYYYDAPRGEKEYLRASKDNIIATAPEVFNRASKIRPFANDKELYQSIKKDKIAKLISVEMGLWVNKEFLKSNDIASYSIQYLSDSIWKNSNIGITKVYYTTEFLKDFHMQSFNIVDENDQHKYVGSPLFDGVSDRPSDGQDILVLLPNLRAEHVKTAFGSADNFIKIMHNICSNSRYNFVFKTRKKQWIPQEIRKYSKEIIEDEGRMYPSIMGRLLNNSFMTIMFYSSGVYECVYGGNYVVNIKLPLNRWSWDKGRMSKYFSDEAGSLYNFDGVIESVSQDDILNGSWKFAPKKIDTIKRIEWTTKYIGSYPENSAMRIVADILS